MMASSLLVAAALLPLALVAQQVGTMQPEVHPPLTTYTCAAGGACTPESSAITLDANWRWTHQVGSATNCYVSGGSPVGQPTRKNPL